MTEAAAYLRSLTRPFIIMGLMFASICAQAQGGRLKVTADRDRILPGERIVLTIEAATPSKGPHVDIPALPDTFNHFEVLRRAEVKREEEDGLTIQRQQVTITGFDNGTWTIPALRLTLGKSVFHSDSLHVTIDIVKLTDSTYHDIRDIVEAPDNAFDWKRWVAIALTLLIIGALVWNYLRGRRKRPNQRVSAAERAGAFDKAQQELKALRGEDLPAKGQMKAYYTRLYDILRNYLHLQEQDPALQRTTDELLMHLKPKLSKDQVGPLAEALRIADAVKFAKYPSAPDEATQAWTSVDATIRTLHQQKPGLDQ